ncbi:MAG: hypothetical protein FWH56_09535, partial [Betaproteobacteria bacterium]|nr:hypothetical protein [Betaproteobacteria bacterium]
MTRLSRALILLFSTLAIQFGTVDAVADTDVTIKGKVEQTQESLGGGDDEVNFQELNIGNIKKPDATTTIIIGGNVKQTQSGQGNKQQLNIGNVDENGGSATVTIQKSLSQHQLGANNEQAINIGNVLKSKEHGGSGTTKVTVASVTQIQTGFNNKQSISVGNTYNKTTDVTVGDIIQLQEGLGKTQIINIGVSNTANTNVTVGNVTQIQTDAHSGACQEIIVGYDSIVTVGDIIQFDDMGLVSGSPRSGRIEIGNSGEIPSCDPKKIVVLDPGTDEDGFRPMPGLSYEESYVEHHPEGVKAREAAEAEAAADAKRNSFERFVHNVTKATDEAWDSVKKTWSDWRADMSVAGFFVAVGDTFIGISAEGTRAWAEAAARFASDVFNDVLGKLPLPDVAKDFLSGTFDTVLAVGLTRYNLSSHFIEGVLSGTWELILLQFHVGEWISNAIGYGLLNLLDLFIDVDQHEFLASRRDHAKKIFDEGWGTITGLASLSYNLNTNPIGTIEGLWEGIKEAFNGCSNARGTAGCVSYIVGNIVPEVVGTKGAVLAARGVASLPRVARMAEAASTAARKIKPVAKALDRYAGSGLQRAVDRVNYVVDIDFITFKNGLPRFQSFKEFSRGAEIMPPVARGIPNDNAPSTKGVYPSNIEMNEVVNNVNTPKVAEAAGRGAPPSTVAVERNSLDLNSGSGVRGPPATTYAAVGGNPTDSIRIGGSAAARSVPPSSPQHTASAATQSSTPTPQPHAAPQTPATGVQTASLDVPQGTPPKADTPTSVASTAHVPGTPEATPERAIVTRGATNERGPNL